MYPVLLNRVDHDVCYVKGLSSRILIYNKKVKKQK